MGDEDFHGAYIDPDPSLTEAYDNLFGRTCPHGLSDPAYCARCVSDEHAKVRKQYELLDRIDQLEATLNAHIGEDEEQATIAASQEAARAQVFGAAYAAAQSASGSSGTKSAGWSADQMSIK